MAYNPMEKSYSKVVLLGKTIAAAAVFASASLVVVPTVQAEENKYQVSQASMPYFINSYLLRSVEAELYRYESAMSLMSYTNNRDDFLINRDELWGSREDLSYALKSLEAYSDAPFIDDDKEIITKLQEIMTKCEEYPNEQNVVISLKAKTVDSTAEVRSLINAVKASEIVASHRNLSESQRDLYEKMQDARSIFETMLISYFDLSESSSFEDFTKQLQNSYNAYATIMGNAIPVFPEVQSKYKALDAYYAKMFNEHGVGTEYYTYVQKYEGQKKTEDYFKKSTRDVQRMIGALYTKLKTRVTF